MRFSLRREVAIGLGVYAAFLLARRLVVNEGGRRRARRNAARVVALERGLRIHVEPELQKLVLPRRRLLAILNVAYVTLNVVFTVGWPMRLFFRRHPEYHRVRRAASLAFLGSTPAFLLFPCAPPRALEGFTDTIREVSGVDLDSGLVAQLYNPIAAMPSVHTAFAVVTATGVVQTAEARWLRGLALAYPPAVVFTILVTANHYVLDAVAGAALGVAALRLSRFLEG